MSQESKSKLLVQSKLRQIEDENLLLKEQVDDLEETKLNMDKQVQNLQVQVGFFLQRSIKNLNH